MKVLLVLLVSIVLSPFSSAEVFADEKSDCLNKCSNEKSSTLMYCPPAGGYSDEEHKQCIEKITAAYIECSKGCYPPPETPQQLPATVDPPLSLPDVHDLPERLH